MIHPLEVENLERNLINGRSVSIIDNATTTKFHITNLEQKTTVGHSQARSATQSIFELTIDEPNGTTLLDTMNRAALTLGIVDFKRAVYILQISFIGRLDNGSSEKHPTSFYYPITMTHVESTVKPEGTTYYIKSVEDYNKGYMYIDGVLKDQITVEGETVGEFVQDLEQKINLAKERALLMDPNSIYAHQYKFKFADHIIEDGWPSWRFETLDNPGSQAGHSVVNGKVQVPINNGSWLPEVIGKALIQTKEYKEIQAFPYGVLREDGAALPTTRDLAAFPKFYKVYPEIRYLQYDPVAGDYQREITYIITDFIVPDEIVDSAIWRRSIANQRVQLNRIDSLMKAGLLKKQFKYLYTGENTDVINLDLKFDLAYYIVTPYGLGRMGDANVLTPRRGEDDLSVIGRLKNAKAEVVGLRFEYNRIQNQQARARSQISSLRASLADEQLSSSDRSRIENDIQQLGSTFAQSEIDSYILEQDISYTENNLNQVVEEFEEEYDLRGSDIEHRIRFLADVINDADGYAPEHSVDGAVHSFGSVVTNLENASDLLSIEMEVRGDPYWLGQPKNFNFVQSNQNVDNDLADYSLGNQMFYLNVFLPHAVEDKSGRRIPDQNFQVSGLYKVIDIISRFQNGQFIQYLNAVHDLGTNLHLVRDRMEAENDAIEGVDSGVSSNTNLSPAQQQENASGDINVA